MVISVPPAGELSEYYQSYLKYLNAEEDLLEQLKAQQHSTQQMLAGISPEMESYRYAPGKWMVKEVVGHFCDTERILCYRALTVARQDKTPLPGFDENTYTPASNYSRRSLANIAEELDTVRSSTITLFKNMDPEMLDFTGTANNTPVSVRALCFFIVAHQKHHLEVIRERYLGSE